jgi:hypothetical protein
MWGGRIFALGVVFLVLTVSPAASQAFFAQVVVSAPAAAVASYDAAEAIGGAAGSEPAVSGRAGQLRRTGLTGSASDACDVTMVPSFVANELALIRRGGCSFVDKVDNAQAKGADGVVLYDNDDAPNPGVINPLVSATTVIPVVMIDSVAGELLDGTIAGGETPVVTLRLDDAEGDGVADKTDACPLVVGVAPSGCPPPLASSPLVVRSKRCKRKKV